MGNGTVADMTYAVNESARWQKIFPFSIQSMQSVAMLGAFVRGATLVWLVL